MLVGSWVRIIAQRRSTVLACGRWRQGWASTASGHGHLTGYRRREPAPIHARRHKAVPGQLPPAPDLCQTGADQVLRTPPVGRACPVVGSIQWTLYVKYLPIVFASSPREAYERYTVNIITICRAVASGVAGAAPPPYEALAPHADLRNLLR